MDQQTETGKQSAKETLAAMVSKIQDFISENPELVGGAVGAGAGGLLGDAADRGVKGTLTGALLGGAVGAGVGNILKNPAPTELEEKPDYPWSVDVADAVITKPASMAYKHPLLTFGVLPYTAYQARKLPGMGPVDETIKTMFRPGESNKWNFLKAIASQPLGGNVQEIADGADKTKEVGYSLGRLLNRPVKWLAEQPYQIVKKEPASLLDRLLKRAGKWGGYGAPKTVVFDTLSGRAPGAVKLMKYKSMAKLYETLAKLVRL